VKALVSRSEHLVDEVLDALAALALAGEVEETASALAAARRVEACEARTANLSWGGGGQRPLVPFLLLGPPFFMILFLSTAQFTKMTLQLPSHAMDPDFTVTWQQKQVYNLVPPLQATFDPQG
jgi:hypothetical protein